MTKNQIALVGSQKLPIYIGALERAPENLYLLHSVETLSQAQVLKQCLSGINVSLLIVKPYDFADVRKNCENLIDAATDQEWELNLTGGTKIMSMAAQSAFQEKGLPALYQESRDSFLNITQGGHYPITHQLSVEDFFKLVDHTSFTYQALANYSSEEIQLCYDVIPRRGRELSDILRNFRSRDNNGSLNRTSDRINSRMGSIAQWDNLIPEFNLNVQGHPALNVATNKGIDIVLRAGWWEVLIAEQAAKWSGARDVRLNVELPFRSEANIKNEIDVLVNMGRALIFIECKSGRIKAEDINKLRVIKSFYGGEAAKAVLASYYDPEARIKERCDELGIKIFSFRRGRRSLSDLDSFLDRVAESGMVN